MRHGKLVVSKLSCYCHARGAYDPTLIRFRHDVWTKPYCICLCILISLCGCIGNRGSSWIFLWRIFCFRSKVEGPEQSFKVIQIVRHPDYNPETKDSDIALLKLDREATLNKNVSLACLPTEPPTDHQTCWITGMVTFFHFVLFTPWTVTCLITCFLAILLKSLLRVPIVPSVRPDYLETRLDAMLMKCLGWGLCLFW